MKRKILCSLMFMFMCMMTVLSFKGTANAKYNSTLSKVKVKYGKVTKGVDDEDYTYATENTTSSSISIELDSNGVCTISGEGSLDDIVTDFTYSGNRNFEGLYFWQYMQKVYNVDFYTNTKKLVFKGNIELPYTFGYDSYFFGQYVDGVYSKEYNDQWANLEEIDFSGAHLNPETENFGMVFCYRWKIDSGTADYESFKKLKTITFPDNFITSNIDYMGYTFDNLNALTTINGLQSFDVSNVTQLRYTFSDCASLTSLDLSSWDTSKCILMNNMFEGCQHMENLNLGGSFNTCNVRDMSDMFEHFAYLSTNGCNVEVGDLWNTAKLTNMSYMFRVSGITNINEILKKCDFTNVEDMDWAFINLYGIDELDLSSLKAPSVTKSSLLFSFDDFYSDRTDRKTYSKLKFFKEYGGSCWGMFRNNSELISIDWNGVRLSPKSVAYMFNGCSNLEALDLSVFDMSNVTNLQCVFNGCTNLKVIDMSSWDCTNVKGEDTRGMLDGVSYDCEIKTPNSVFMLPHEEKQDYNGNKTDSKCYYLVDNNITESGTYLSQTKTIKKISDHLSIKWDFDGGSCNQKSPINGGWIHNSYDISQYKATKTNYEFLGWKINNEGDYVTEIPANTYYGTITIYAVFSPCKYNITYNNVEDLENPNPSEYSYGGEVVFKEIQKAGYSFDGWFTDEEFKVPITKITSIQSGDKVLYAKFTDNHTDTTTTGAKEATCEEDGYTGTTTCNVCGKTISENTVIPATGHAEEVRNAEKATCGKNGYTGDTYCKTCNKKLADGEVIPATGNHTWNDGEVTTQATETTTGVRTYTCTVCGAHKEEVIPVITPEDDHTKTEIRGRVEATCQKEGYTGDTYCSVCNKLLAKGEVIDKKEHSFVSSVTKSPTKETYGERTYTCTDCGFSKIEVIDKLDESSDISDHKDTINIEDIKEDVVLKPNTEISVPTSGVKVNGMSVDTSEGIITFDTDGTYNITIGEKVYRVVVSTSGVKEEPKADDKGDGKTEPQQDKKPTEVKGETKQDTPKKDDTATTVPTTVVTPTAEERVLLNKVSSVKVKSKKKRVTISWKSVKDTKSYEVQIAKNKKMKKSLKKYKVKGTKKVIKLKKGKYFIRVRAVNGKTTGAWSKIKQFKVK